VLAAGEDGKNNLTGPGVVFVLCVLIALANADDDRAITIISAASA
jgi:hypothetical protein